MRAILENQPVKINLQTNFILVPDFIQPNMPPLLHFVVKTPSHCAPTEEFFYIPTKYKYSLRLILLVTNIDVSC
jgi:hypothetical protein